MRYARNDGSVAAKVRIQKVLPMRLGSVSSRFAPAASRSRARVVVATRPTKCAGSRSLPGCGTMGSRSMTASDVRGLSRTNIRESPRMSRGACGAARGRLAGLGESGGLLVEWVSGPPPHRARSRAALYEAVLSGTRACATMRRIRGSGRAPPRGRPLEGSRCRCSSSRTRAQVREAAWKDLFFRHC